VPALDEAYPGLAPLPRLLIAETPTPVDQRENPPFSESRIYVKRDDLSGRPYGGNKVRKLAFLLGHAMETGAKAVLTFGAAGSNHALATAIYARQHGLDAISMLGDQPNARSVRKNLLRHLAAGADIRYAPDRLSMARHTREYLFAYRRRDGVFPYVIPSGGSSPLGAAGFVDAAFELRRQIEAGLLPEPDLIYVASGTMGTAIGLLAGVLAAGLKTRIMAVRVTPAPFSDPGRGQLLFHATNRLLHETDPAFPLPDWPEDRFILRDEFFGGEYGRHTPASVKAVEAASAHAGLHLEGTYTGKTFAALLSDLREGMLRNKTALFWNTYNSRDLSSAVSGMDYRQLPAPFHRYFETEAQPLDRDPAGAQEEGKTA
jgi:1-aminocyclopropane-1-carboxylate deaminase/D-cysteine desulfhydrase-like pyridoxal-dependent ACC family enzyme